MSDNSKLRASGVTAPAASVTRSEPGFDRDVGRLDPHRDAVDRWSAALARGDEAEVDRLVRQSRIDRAWLAASGQIGAMVDQARPAASSEFAEPGSLRDQTCLPTCP